MLENNPILEKMKNCEEVFWRNMIKDSNNIFSSDDIEGAKNRLLRFAPFLRLAFPETVNGIIESPVRRINQMKECLGANIKGNLYLKCDSELPISGSIKARGGIYEVLCIAEEIAVSSGLLKTRDDYSVLMGDEFHNLFSKYSIAVGSTGNLGLSIGIMGTKLGFKVTVHMSSDAKKWKKDLLREKGAVVIEYSGDYELAVANGRKQAESDDFCYFIDDENSQKLFLGYSVAAGRLFDQLREMNICVDENNPLYVYLPCGVGGGPGGVAYGLKQIYKENVKCYFAEPVQAPCMLLGVMTGLKNQISALDIGLTGKTCADGLAVNRASKLVCSAVGGMLHGFFTVSDENLCRYVKMLYNSCGIFIEPSAAAGFKGLSFVEDNENANHIIWATGGNMVPEYERQRVLDMVRL